MSKKKVLLVFDLNTSLMLAIKKNKLTPEGKMLLLEKLAPNDNVNSMNIFYRPGRVDFLDYFFLKSHVKFKENYKF